MNMEGTLERLEEIYHSIKKLRVAYETDDDNVVEAFVGVVHSVNDAEQAKLISKDMAEEYRSMLQAMQRHEERFDDGIEALRSICQKQTDDCEKANNKMSSAFEFDFTNYDKTAQDSPKTLEHISDLMRFYENVYENTGELDAVDVLCEIADAINNAIKDKEISEGTAKSLIEPLESIKRNMFDKDKQQKAVQSFKQILQGRINASNGNEKQKNPIDKIADKIKSFASEGKTQKTPNDNPSRKQTVKTPQKKKLEEKFREFKAKDKETESKVFSKTREEDLTKEEKQEEARPEFVDTKNLTEEEALDHLYDLLNKYEKAYRTHEIERSPETRDASVNAWDDFIKYSSRRDVRGLVFSSPEMKSAFDKATWDVTNRDKSIPAIRDMLQKAMHKSANKEAVPVKDKFNMGQERHFAEQHNPDTITGKPEQKMQNDEDFRAFQAKDKEQRDIVDNLNNNEKKPEEKKIEPKDNFRDEVKNVLDSHEDMFEKRDKVASFRAGIEKTKDLTQKRTDERMVLFMKKKKINNSWGE